MPIKVRFAPSPTGLLHVGNARTALLNAIPTRFALPQESVDALIAAGAEALRNNAKYQAFKRGL